MEQVRDHFIKLELSLNFLSQYTANDKNHIPKRDKVQEDSSGIDVHMERSFSCMTDDDDDVIDRKVQE